MTKEEYIDLIKAALQIREKEDAATPSIENPPIGFEAEGIIELIGEELYEMEQRVVILEKEVVVK